MQPYVVALSEDPATDPQLCGTKAAELAVLFQAGLPVPAGVIVTTAVFRTAPHGEVTPDIEAALEEKLAPIGRPLALRASAAVRDHQDVQLLGQAFGAHLGLTSSAQLVRTIEEMWQSAGRPAALAAYERLQISPESVELAILIQPQLVADASGLLHSTGRVEQTNGQRLSGAEEAALVQLGEQAQRQLAKPRTLEWARVGGELVIIQTR